MAKQIVWKDLTPSESRTLEQLKRAGKEIFEAPIEIESADQLHAMGLTWDQCRTWYFGTKRVTVHLTPSDEQTYRFLRDELRAKHRSEYRERRCMIPGKLKPLIPCPEKNSCKNCPYPQCRDSQLPDLSWDEYVDAMSGVAQAMSIAPSGMMSVKVDDRPRLTLFRKPSQLRREMLSAISVNMAVVRATEMTP